MKIATLILGLIFAVPSFAGAVDGCNKDSESFWSRLKDSYQSHLAWNGDTSPPVKIVGGSDIPESEPPWAYSTWNEGGTESIGVENIHTGPLMDAIYCGEDGQAWKDSRFTIYGWFEPGFNISTSHTRFNYSTGTGGNYPAAYSFEPNTIQMDQLALYFERTPDEIQRDHFDWGFRVTGMYGTDYKYTMSDGVLSNQYLKDGKMYGFDPVMYYMDFWFPRVAQGMNVRVGRYVSLPDIEAQLAPDNNTYTHSLLYIFDPYTQHGIVSTIKLTKNWQVQGELSAGNDVAPWIKGEARVTPALCVIWTSDSGKDNFQPCMNGLNGGDWRWNNVQQAVATWYHKFNDTWHTSTEVYYMWENHVPNVNNPNGAEQITTAYPTVRYGAPGGAFCSSPTALNCTSYSWAVLNYINYKIGPRDIVSFRSDFLDDAKGERTGFKTRYYEFGLGYGHWIGDAIQLRPEIRFEHAMDVDAYDNPTATPGAGKNSQFMFAMDAIFHF